jgi:hypothetical protein
MGETGESRKDRPSFPMADDEGRVLAAQSLYAVKQFGYQSKLETFNAGPRRPRHLANRAAHLLIPPFRRTNAASGSALVLYSAAYRKTRDHFGVRPWGRTV